MDPFGSNNLDKVLQTHKKVVLEGYSVESEPKSRGYAVSNLRGGVGKTSLTFNIGYELSRRQPLLIADVCPQANLTEVIIGIENYQVAIYNALPPRVLGSAFGEEASDIYFRASQYRQTFAGGK